MSIHELDVRAMYAAMDAQRAALGLTWPKVARALWDQSAVLNERRGDHPISPATLTGIAKRGDCTCQHAVFILRWLDRAPEDSCRVPAMTEGTSTCRRRPRIVDYGGISRRSTKRSTRADASAA